MNTLHKVTLFNLSLSSETKDMRTHLPLFLNVKLTTNICTSNIETACIRKAAVGGELDIKVPIGGAGKRHLL
jgi:hypothetical protein